MSRKKHSKFLDEQIVRFNAVGLSLSSIGKLLGCHPSTITNRLKNLGVDALDSRRSFMEDILVTMPEEQQEWIVNLMEERNTDIKQYITELLNKEYEKHV